MLYRMSVTGMIIAIACAAVFPFIHEDHINNEFSQAPEQEERIENITQIFLHEPGVYTIHVYAPETKSATSDYLHNKYTPVEFVYDAPDGKLAWLVISYRTYNEDRRNKKLTFHIHPNEKLLGAGWDHGKGGRGRTNVIE